MCVPPCCPYVTLFPEALKFAPAPHRACSPADAVAVLRAMGLWLLHDEPEVGPGAEAVAAQALAVGARGSGSRGGFERVRGPLALPRGRGCHAKWRRAFASLQIEV